MQLILSHAGSPSTTWNAGLAGLIDACRDEGEAIRILGARRGAEGLLAGEWADLTAVSPAKLEGVMRTPASVIGASRRTLTADEAHAVVARLGVEGVDALVYSGGAAAMAAAALLAKAAAEAKSALKVIGLPNSAENDVTCTDHSPGFASAARFYSVALRDMCADNGASPAAVTVIETIGRRGGWVAAATALGRTTEDDGPHLLYLPERLPEEEQVHEDVRAAVDRYGLAVVTLCEGPAGASGTDVARSIQTATGLATHVERFGLLGRSSSLAVSEVDVEESYRCGRAAAEAALGGAAASMITLRRRPGAGYSSFPNAVPFSENPGRERPMPSEFLSQAGQGATPEYLEWLRPLVGEIPPLERIP